jgi:single-stranded DNA-binding protein
MIRDINVIIISGIVDTAPSVITTRNNSRICLFNLLNIERYRLFDGKPAQHDNYLTIEVLGKNVDKVLTGIKQGDRVTINGYLRVDEVNGVEHTKVRMFHIEKDY